MLSQPIIVEVLDTGGVPFADKLVKFHVTRSDGLLSADGTSGFGQTLQERTDDQGLVQLFWKLGSDAGCGNNRVEVTSTSILGTTFFCASATPGPASQINIGSGASQRGETAGPAPEPLRVWVNDACNGVAGVPVTFKVVQGAGLVDGLSEVTVQTGVTGHADVSLALGLDEGNNVVVADFSGNANQPASFTVFAADRNEFTAAEFSGIVLDNADQPIEGTTCALVVGGQTFGPLTSNLDGTFRFTAVNAAGPADLFVDGTTAFHIGGAGGLDVPPGSFPSLHYETIVTPNVDNHLPTPVLLPRLNPNNDVLFDNSQDVELTMEGVEGLRFIVTAGSMTLADGTVPEPGNPATLSINQVHQDDVPMPMPDGAGPPLAWTLQPAGAQFDPPVQVIVPNMAGLPPGAISYTLSFDHDSGRFEIVATATVSEDGLSIISDPGSGITKSGWGAICPPYPNTGTVCACKTGQTCPNGTCVPLLCREDSDCDDMNSCTDDFCEPDLGDCTYEVAEGCGACCIHGRCLLWSGDGCTTAGGLYQGDGVSCDGLQCPHIGACCDNNSGCTETSPEDCSGRYLGDGSFCNGPLGNPCPLIGACCTTTGCSEFVTRNECERMRDTELQIGGRYLGDGSACTDGDETCAGACCFVTGCLDVENRFECFHEVGEIPIRDEFLGEGTNCDEDTCGGACCVGGECSLVAHPSECAGLLFAGHGTVCEGDNAIFCCLFNCDDDEPCTENACDFVTGMCSNPPILCNDGINCTFDSCAETNFDPFFKCRNIPCHEACDDGDPNTIDACSPLNGGCLHFHKATTALDETYTVSVGGQSVSVNSDGTFVISNVAAPDAFGTDGSGSPPDGFSDASFQVIGIGMIGGDVPIKMTSGCFQFPIPGSDMQQEGFSVELLDSSDPNAVESLIAIAEFPTLTEIGENTMFDVLAVTSDGTVIDYSSLSGVCPLGCNTSNTAIVDLDGDCIATANGAGTAAITFSAGAISTAALVTVSLGDPLTSVEGYGRHEDDSPAEGALVTLVGQSGSDTTDADGHYEIAGVATEVGDITVLAQLTIGDDIFTGVTPPIAPVSAGVTDGGIITLYHGNVWIRVVDGDWTEPKNWVLGTPGPTDRAVINLHGDYKVSVDSNVRVGDCLLDEDGATLSVSGADLTADGDVTIANGTLELLAGDVRGRGMLHVDGCVTVSGVSVIEHTLHIGAQGSLTIEGDGAAGNTKLTLTTGGQIDGTATMTSTNGPSNVLIQCFEAIELGEPGTIEIQSGTGGAREFACDLTSDGTVNIGTNTDFIEGGSDQQQPVPCGSRGHGQP